MKSEVYALGKKINIIITENSNNDIVLKIKKKLINISKYKIIFLKEKKRGAVYARNKFLKKIKNINPDYICFFDDDCTIDKYWIKNTFKIIDTKKADVVTGPQLYIGSLKRKIYNYSQIFEKKYPEAMQRINERRIFMKDKLGINLKPEVMPLSNMPAYLNPFILSKNLTVAFK